MSNSPSRNVTRQREAGAAARAETRRRLLGAAGDEFGERGYHAATVSRIASRAGVTVQTLYLAWGSKRALLRAYMDASLSGTPDTSYVDERPQLIERSLDGTGTDAHAMVVHIAALHCQIAARAALGWQLYRDAAASDEEIAADWQALQHLRRETFATVIRRIPVSALRSDMTVEAAIDTAWTIASPETYELLVRTAKYTPANYQQWVATTLCAVLLEPSVTAGQPGRYRAISEFGSPVDDL